jgi:sugar/nucleoside kinase (ribokinase family)
VPGPVSQSPAAGRAPAAGEFPLIGILGDAHLDVVVAVEGPVAPDTDTPARTLVTVGGQGANVAAWVAALGGRSRLIATWAPDTAAALVRAELTRRGVGLVGPEIAGAHTGVVVALSDGGTARSMLTDRGAGPLLSAAAIEPGWLDGCAWLHLPAYSLVAVPVQSAALSAASAARARGGRISVDLSSTAAIEHYGVAAFRGVLADLRPDLVFGTKAETALTGPLPQAQVVTKLGADGVLAGGQHYPALPARAVDATGAGDAFAAGYLVGGVRLGLEAAARAVATMGAMP